MPNPSLPNLNRPDRPNRYLALVIVVSLLMIFLTQSYQLWDKYRVVPDVQNSYWMARFQDPTLFAIDYLFSRRLIDVNVMGVKLIFYPLSLGWGLLFHLVSFVIDYVWFTKWLIFILLPICVVYLFKLGQLLDDDFTGVSLSLGFTFFILASSQAMSPVTGLQRGFAIPILIVFVYYMIREQYIGASLMIVMSALIYWPNFPLVVLTYGLSFIIIKPRFKLSLDISRAKLLPFIGSLLLSILLLIPLLIVEFQLFVPRDVPTLQDPNYQSEGAASMWISFPWLGRAGIFNIGADVINFLVLLILGFLVYKSVGRKSLQRVPKECWHLLIAAAIMYVASIFVFIVLSSSALYQPSRYTRTVLILIPILFLGLNWKAFLEKAPIWFRSKAPLIIFFITSLTLAFGAVYLIFPNRLLLVPLFWFLGWILSGISAVLGVGGLFWLFRGTKRWLGMPKLAANFFVIGIIIASGTFYMRWLGVRMMNPSEAERSIYEFVGSLPKDSVLAGNPIIMSGIPLFSQRSVLFRDLIPSIHPNAAIFIQDFFDAQYAESPEVVLGFCQRHQISYLVVDNREFASDYLAKKDFFYQPYNDEIVAMVANRSNFVLPQIKPVFTSGPFEVIKCDPETMLANK